MNGRKVFILRRRSIIGVAASAISSLVLAACGSSKPASTTTAPLAKSTTTTLPSNLSPLTGEPLASPAAAQVPALAVKIDNAPQAWPQSGIDQADVVYEEVVEGGLTRYMAIFQSQQAPVVGPIRSVRKSDAYIIDPIGGLFAYSGGIPAFVAELHATGVVDVGASSAAGGAYYRSSSRPAPHNLFSSTTALRNAAGGKGTPPPKLLDFGSASSSFNPPGAKPATTVTVNVSGAVNAVWSWDSASSQWTRSTNAVRQFDSSGQPVSATNVIVEDISYQPTGFVDPAHNPVPWADSVGTGSAYFLSNGEIAQGSWSKSSESSVTNYTTSSGTPMKLTPGRTWIMLVQSGTPVTTS